MIELARVLSQYSFKRSIIYLNTNGEEMGASGGASFAHYCREHNINIICVFNIDMLGYNPIDEPLILFHSRNSGATLDLEKYYNEVANLYLTDIPTIQSDKASAGDCYFFRMYDYPAMYIGDPHGI